MRSGTRGRGTRSHVQAGVSAGCWPELAGPTPPAGSVSTAGRVSAATRACSTRSHGVGLRSPLGGSSRRSGPALWGHCGTPRGGATPAWCARIRSGPPQPLALLHLLPRFLRALIL